MLLTNFVSNRQDIIVPRKIQSQSSYGDTIHSINIMLGAFQSIFSPKIRSKFGKTRKTIVFTSSLKIKNGQIFWKLWYLNIIQAVSSHKNQFLRSFSDFSNIVRKFSSFKYCCFELIFGQEMDSKASSANFFHIRIVHKKFQLKIPTLRKNDCSATWKPNTYQKNDTCGKVRNIQRYQKYVAILRSFIFKFRISSSQQWSVH